MINEKLKMTNQQATEKITSLSNTSFGIMFLNFFFTIVLGPQISHYINIFALLLTIASIWILIKNRLINYKPILNIIFVLFLGFLGAYFKYGYSGWHYRNLFELVRPK